jgi:hypothetical protein
LGEDTAVDGSLRSPGGGIQVSTTERGLPVALRLDASELKKPAAELADEILALCQLSGRRRQVARRRELVARGVSAAVIGGLNLCTEDELAQAETRFRQDDEDDGPDTWLGPA